MIDLIYFASETEDDRGRDVGMIEHAGQSALQLHRIGADRVPAALTMRESHHAVDVRRHHVVLEACRDELRRVRGAVARGDHGDVVARAGAAIIAREAEERRHIVRGRR